MTKMPKTSIKYRALALILSAIAALNCTGCSFFGISYIKFGTSSHTSKSADDTDNSGSDSSSANSSDSDSNSDSDNTAEASFDYDTLALDSYEDPIESAPGEDLTDLEREYFSKLLSSDEYGGYLVCSYKTVDDIDLKKFFYQGAGIAETDVSQEEINKYFYELGYVDTETVVISFDRQTLESYMKSHLGLDYDPGTVRFSAYYLKEYDKYYLGIYEDNQMEYKARVMKGKKDGERFYLRVESPTTKAKAMYVVIEKKDDIYMAKSCVYLWEEECYEYFDADLPQYEGKVRLCRNGHILYVLEDRNLIETLEATCDSIVDIAYTDLDIDGRNDIIITYKKDSKKYVTVVLDPKYSYGFYSSRYFDNVIKNDLDNLEMDTIKNYLFKYAEEDAENYTISQAYSQFLYISNLYYPDYKYKFMDINGDGYQDLCLDYNSSSHTTIAFIYRDGHLQYLFYYGEYTNVEHYYSNRTYSFLSYEDIKGDMDYEEALKKALDL